MAVGSCRVQFLIPRPYCTLDRQWLDLSMTGRLYALSAFRVFPLSICHCLHLDLTTYNWPFSLMSTSSLKDQLYKEDNSSSWVKGIVQGQPAQSMAVPLKKRVSLSLRLPASVTDRWFPPVQAAFCNASKEHHKIFVLSFLELTEDCFGYTCVYIPSLERGQPSVAEPC